MSKFAEEFSKEYKSVARFVDADYYRRRYALSDDQDPVGHYLSEGAQQLNDPSEYFSTEEYLALNQDVADSGLNPLLHYVEFGAVERRCTLSKDAKALRSSGIATSDDRLLRSDGWELPCIITDEDVSREGADVSGLMAQLNETLASAVILKRDSKDWLVVFSGMGEKFFFIRKMMTFWGNVLFIRDKSETYYCGNPRLPDISHLDKYIEYLTGERTGRTVLFGQSYGGLTALYESAYIRNCLTFAFSPQAFHPVKYPHGIYFEKSIKKANLEETAPDLFSHIKEAPYAPRYVVAGVSEVSHAQHYYWGDALGAGLLAATGKVVSIVVNRNEHSTVHYLDSKKFFKLVRENYDTFMHDRHDAAMLLANGEVYYESAPA